MNSNYGITGNPFADMQNYQLAKDFGSNEDKAYWERNKEYAERLTRGFENEYRFI